MTDELLLGTSDEAVFRGVEPGVVTVMAGNHTVTLCPDGSFLVDGELVNADDKERGVKLYAAFLKLLNVF
jgi:hypothetical protein